MKKTILLLSSITLFSCTDTKEQDYMEAKKQLN